MYIDGPQVKLETAHPQTEQTSPDHQVDPLSPVPSRAEGLELCLTLRCGHMGSREAQSLLAKPQGAIYELHVLESLVFTANIFPLNNLRVLAFLLTRKAKPTQHWSVLESIPNLEFLQIYNEKSAARIPDFLQAMPRLKKVTTLKVATDHFFLCLQAKYLQHVTHLQLGGQVTVDHLPTALRLLRLEVFNDGLSADAYLLWFWEIDQHDTSIEITLENSTAAALQHLPTKLHGLKLLHSFEEDSASALQMLQFHQAFSRLTMLRSLVIADFITPYVSYMLSGLMMHYVHTFNFCLAFDAIPEEEMHMDDGRLLVIPAHPVPISVFPNLNHVRVYTAPNRKMVPDRLNCKWLDAFFFGKLQTITIYCPQSRFTWIYHVPPIIFFFAAARMCTHDCNDLSCQISSPDACPISCWAPLKSAFGKRLNTWTVVLCDYACDLITNGFSRSSCNHFSLGSLLDCSAFHSFIQVLVTKTCQHKL